ncbi:STAS domain-containing protein [Streptosporangium sp. NPDC050855]|uniref:STAS domain-containing protein n=1 Tax=Streptosporangium sp. NPDC050855 TaxID=3366194 RepID=UPI0037B0172E
MSISPQTGPLDPCSEHDGDPPRGGGLRIDALGPPPGLQVSGEVDRTTRRLWQEALSELVSGGGDRHLYLSGLTFIDVRGAWLLEQSARALVGGGRLFLHSAPYCLRSVLALIGSDSVSIEVKTK